MSTPALATARAAKLVEIDQRITDLRRMRRAIAGLLALPCIDPAAPCAIIASLATASATAPAPPSRKRR